MGAAWWTTYMEKPSCRVWGILASILNILAALLPFYLYKVDHSREGLTATLQLDVVVFAVGIAGLLAYGRRFKPSAVAAQAQDSAAVPGDGTSAILNKAIGLITFVLTYVAYSWWSRWVAPLDLWVGRSFLARNLTFIVMLFFVIVVHEAGHAAAGVALGMRLRLIALGPFQWIRKKCKWTFDFTLKRMGRYGVVGLLPATARPPHWHGAVVAMCAPVANLITGVVALLFVLGSVPDEWGQLTAVLALFGSISIAVGISQAIPFRVGHFYSDGARIYQHLSDSPRSALLRVLDLVMAVTETPFRPRDYDVDAINSALRGYPGGMEGHFLKLYAYDHYADKGELAEACRTLQEAEVIYDAAGLKAETEVSFVLGHAALRRDAASARKWWDRLEARGPDKSESGVWLAKCALDWGEGRNDDAKAALIRANALIDEMPATGSRAFDIEWSQRLQRAIQESAT